MACEQYGAGPFLPRTAAPDMDCQKRANQFAGKAGLEMNGFRFCGLAALALLSLLMASPPLIAASPYGADMEVRMDVVRVANLSVLPVDFGTVLINGESGSVMMGAAGDLNYSGGVIQVQGFSQPGELTLDGDSGITATISFPALVDMGNGVTFRPQADRTMVMLNGGPETVLIFGEMIFPNATTSGSHLGLLPIEVTYN
jgi:hypothetical protein